MGSVQVLFSPPTDCTPESEIGMCEGKEPSKPRSPTPTGEPRWQDGAGARAQALTHVNLFM